MPPKAKRKYTRFNADPLDTALIQLLPRKNDFKPDFAALIVNEAHGGCGLIVISKVLLQIGDLVRVKVGPVSPLLGIIVWRNSLAPSIQQIGIEYLE